MEGKAPTTLRCDKCKGSGTIQDPGLQFVPRDIACSKCGGVGRVPVKPWGPLHDVGAGLLLVLLALGLALGAFVVLLYFREFFDCLAGRVVC